jgi:hypothetical protein
MSVQFQIYSPMPAAIDGEGPLTRTIRWRLVASNNRAMAGSVNDFGTFAEARTAIAQLLDVLPTADVRLASTPDDKWRWTLLTEGIPAAWSLRTYARRLECEQSAASVVRLAPLAEPAHVLRVFGDRRGRVMGRVQIPRDGEPAEGSALEELVVSAADLPLLISAAPRVRLPERELTRRPPVSPTSRDRRALPR